MKIIATIFLTMASVSFYSQSIHHQMMSSQSNTSDTSSGLTIRQTIGQLSATGSFSDNYIVQQGYHQSNWGTYLSNPKNILVQTYPNPFVDIVNFKFNNLNKKKISIQVFDINGEIVYAKEGLAENNLYSVNLKNLSIGMYLVKLNGEKLSHFSKIFKQ